MVGVELTASLAVFRIQRENLESGAGNFGGWRACGLGSSYSSFKKSIRTLYLVIRNFVVKTVSISYSKATSNMCNESLMRSAV